MPSLRHRVLTRVIAVVRRDVLGRSERHGPGVALTLAMRAFL